MTNHVPHNSFLDLLWATFSRDPARCIYKYLEDGDSNEISVICAELDQRTRQILSCPIYGEKVITTVVSCSRTK